MRALVFFFFFFLTGQVDKGNNTLSCMFFSRPQSTRLLTVFVNSVSSRQTFIPALMQPQLFCLEDRLNGTMPCDTSGNASCPAYEQEEENFPCLKNGTHPRLQLRISPFRLCLWSNYNLTSNTYCPRQYGARRIDKN